MGYVIYLNLMILSAANMFAIIISASLLTLTGVKRGAQSSVICLIWKNAAALSSPVTLTHRFAMFGQSNGCMGRRNEEQYLDR